MSKTPPAHHPGWAAEPPDPDSEPVASPRWAVLIAISGGGMIGAGARYQVGLMWSTKHGEFPWTTLGINIIGCALMGVLMVVITERFTVHPLTQPLLGTGVLGGFTTFSTYIVDTQQLMRTNAYSTAALYLVGTLAGATVVVWAAAAATRWLTRGFHR